MRGDIMAKRQFTAGTLVRHFKYWELPENERSRGDKQYVIIGNALHTETSEEVVVYRELSTGRMFVRPIESFYSEVDRDKYPDAKQQYRIEAIEP